MHYPRFNFTRIFTSIAIAIAVIFIFVPVKNSVNAATGINRQINFQGKLVNNPAATNVTDTSYTIVFTLYNNPNVGGGTALWTETQTVTTTDGIFRVALGSVTPFPANFNFNWDGLYLGININSNGEMTPRIQMAAVPFAFNAQQVAGLTVQDSTSGAASTSATLKIGDATIPITVNLGTNNLTFTTSGTTTIALPATGTLLTNTTAVNQTITSTQTTGNILSLADSTGLASAITGFTLGLTSSTNSQNKTGISFDLLGGTGGIYYDLLGTGSTWSITRAGALHVASCDNCGGVGSVNWWNQLAGALSPVNITNDLLLGGISTSSALFSFTGIQSGQTIASTSGNLIIMPNNGWGGQLGIGTTAPNQALDVRGSGIFGNQLAYDVTAQPNRSKTIYANELTTNTIDDMFSTAGSLEVNPAGATSRIYYGGLYNVLSTSGNAQNFTGRLVGFQGQVSHKGTGTLAQARGFAGIITNDSTGTITDAFAGRFGNTNISTGSYTNAYGIYILSPINSGGGTYNTNYGLYVQDQSNVGIVGSYNIWSDGFNSKNYFAGSVGIGATPSARLHVAGSWGSNAAAIVDQLNSGDILVASASGTTKFVITNAGSIGLYGTNPSITNTGANTLTLNTGSTGDIQFFGSAYKITSDGALTIASCVGCGGGSSGPFAELTGVNGGVIVPNNSTEDFLIGGQSTASADFAILGLATGKTIASISGNLIVYPNNGWGGYLGVNTLNPLANLTVLGTGLFQTPIASKAAFQVQNSSGAPIFIVDSTNPTNLLTNPGFELGISGWSSKTSSTISWNNLAKNFVYFGQASIKVVTATSANSGVSTNAFTQTITAGTYSISFYAKMGSGTLTTLKAGYNQGAADVPCSLNNNTVNNKGFQRYTCTFTSSGSLSYIYIDQGTTSTSNTLYIDSVQLQSGSSVTPYAIGTLELRGIIDAPASFQSGSDSITALQIQNAAGTSNLFIADTLDNAIGIGTNLPLATLDIRGLTGTTSIASVSGRTSYAALVVDNAGNAGVGDLFTASASGATRFVIAQNGTVTIGTSTNGLIFNPISGGPTYNGTARILKTITLSPEYAGAILTASNSANINGSMTSDASPSASWRTYYEWTSTDTNLNDYTVAVRVTLPNDFSDWQVNNALSIDYETASSLATTNKFDLIIYNPSDPKPSTPVVMRTANVSVTGKTWSTLNIPNSALTAGTAQWDIASQSATFYIKMYASGTYNYVHIGDIDLNYIAKF